MLENYVQVKTQLLNACDEIENADYIEKNPINQFDLQKAKLDLQDNVFKIAVLCLFGSSKTTFINTLLGIEIMVPIWPPTLTRIGYSKEVSIEIRYADGKVKQIKKEYKGQELSCQNIELIRNILLEETAGQEENCQVREVIIKYPFEFCKNGLEIIEMTMGRYENYDEIVFDILSRVNANIILLSPNTIGNREVTQTVKLYMDYADCLNLNKEIDNIFMVMNKVDTVYQQELIPLLEEEIKKTLYDKLPNSHIYSVSSYYAFKARMVLNGHENIDYIQKDRLISVSLLDDDIIYGMQWNMENLSLIIDKSNFLPFEKALNDFLENEGEICISRLRDMLLGMLRNNITQLENRRNSLMFLLESENRENKLTVTLKQDKKSNEFELAKLEDALYKNYNLIVKVSRFKRYDS